MPTTKPTASPTLAQTVAPTVKPTKEPTSAPTNAAPVDCRASCTIVSSSVPISAGTKIGGWYQLPTNFLLTITFDHTALSTMWSECDNILELSDALSSASLLSICACSDLFVTVYYASSVVFDQNLAIAPTTESTTITMSILNGRIDAASSASGGITSETLAGNVNTTGRNYELYLSNIVNPSAGGFVSYLKISGKYLADDNYFDLPSLTLPLKCDHNIFQ